MILTRIYQTWKKIQVKCLINKIMITNIPYWVNSIKIIDIISINLKLDFII